MGTLGAVGTTTLAANPHLKAILGYPEDAAESLVQPFDISRFVDPQARHDFIEKLDKEGGVTEHLLRLRRVDGAPIWVEVSATASYRTSARTQGAKTQDLTHRGAGQRRQRAQEKG